jgi:hypothetical protein
MGPPDHVLQLMNITGVLSLKRGPSWVLPLVGKRFSLNLALPPTRLSCSGSNFSPKSFGMQVQTVN